MFPRRAVAVVAVALFGLGYGSKSHAYCRTTTCETCVQPAGACIEEGHQLYWPVSCMTYDVQADASRWADYETARAIADVSFGAWKLESTACPDTGVPPFFQLSNLGPVACDRHEYNDQQNSYGGNANIVVFRDDEWTATKDPHTLALTTVTYNRNTGEIYDADIEVNSHIQLGMRGISTNARVPNDSFDLQSILTHEAGHFFGLAHSQEPCSAGGIDCPTMDAMYRTGSDDFRTLEADDIAGICAIYPADRSAIDNACAPRHGFSTDCGSTGNRGCCSTAPGAASSQGAEGFYAALLGIALWAVRVRRKST
jgi:hypothetical protein